MNYLSGGFEWFRQLLTLWLGEAVCPNPMNPVDLPMLEWYCTAWWWFWWFKQHQSVVRESGCDRSRCGRWPCSFPPDCMHLTFGVYGIFFASCTHNMYAVWRSDKHWMQWSLFHYLLTAYDVFWWCHPFSIVWSHRRFLSAVLLYCIWTFRKKMNLSFNSTYTYVYLCLL